MTNTSEILMIDKAIKWCSYCTKIRQLTSNYPRWHLHFQHSESFNQLSYYFVKRIQKWQKKVATHYFETIMNENGQTFFGYGFESFTCPFDMHLALLDHASNMLDRNYESDNVGTYTKTKIKSWFTDILSDNIHLLGEEYPESEEYVSVKKLIQQHSNSVNSPETINDRVRVIEYTYFDPEDLFIFIAHIVKHHFAKVLPHSLHLDRWCQVSGKMMKNLGNVIFGMDNYADFLEWNNFTREQVEWRSFPDLFLLTRELTKKDINSFRSEISWNPLEREKIHECMEFFEDLDKSIASIHKKIKKAETTSFSEIRKLHGENHVHAPDQTLDQCEDDTFITGTNTLYLSLPTKHHSSNVYFGNGRGNKRIKERKKRKYPVILHPWEVDDEDQSIDHNENDNESEIL
jgi:hypothetical protein